MAKQYRPKLKVWRSLLVVFSLALLAMWLVLGLAVASGNSNTTIRPESGFLIRITTASGSDRNSRSPSLSADGTRIAFASDSDFFNQGIADNQSEVWLYDTTTATLTRITTATDATRSSSAPSLSADGTKIAFVGNSDLLGQGILDGQMAVWLYNTQTMTYTRLAIVLDNSLDHPRRVGPPDLSADGTRVAFQSNSSLLGQYLPEYQYEIWLYDTATMTLTRITSASGAYRSSGHPRLSADGTEVGFHSNSDFLGQGIPYGQFEIWLYDTTTMTYTRITTSTGGDSAAPAISADGTRIVFNSNADFLDQGANHFEVWLYDTSAMTYTRVTISDFPRDSWSYVPELSRNGTIVAFVSDSDFLGEDAVEGQYKLWLYNTATMTYTRVTDSGSSGFGRDPTSLNADGTVLAFSDNTEIWLYKALDVKSKMDLPMVLKYAP